MSLTAITREVNAAMGSCELTFLPRVSIDIALAQQQHQHYQSVLSSLGCEMVVVPTEPGLADSVFVEDTAIVLDEFAVSLRPGAASRLPEVAGVEHVLKKHRMLKSIQPPGTLDGGDLLRIDNIIFAGLSTRSNRSGVEQFRHIVAEYGYSVTTIETTMCLHLKSAVSEVAPGTLLINPHWISRSAFRDFELIEIDEKEAHAANALMVGQSVVCSASFPRTIDRLVSRGIDVIPVELSELQKAEGAVTCCSLIYTAP
jgi:dimethylargininase